MNNRSPESDLRLYRNALGTFGTGVAIVTTSHEGEPCGMTINSFSSVSLEPPLILWSISERASYFDVFQHCDSFAVHILSTTQQALCEQFARPGDKQFSHVDWTWDDSGNPCLPDCLARYECDAETVYPGGDHQIIIGRVRQFETAMGYPLLFVGGHYQQGNQSLGV